MRLLSILYLLFYHYCILSIYIPFYDFFFHLQLKNDIEWNFKEKEDRINIERVLLGDKKILTKAYEDTEIKAGEYIDLSSRRTDDDSDDDKEKTDL